MSLFASSDLLGLLDRLLPKSIAQDADALTRNRGRMLVVVVAGAVLFAVASAAFHRATDGVERALFNLACAPLGLLVLASLHAPVPGGGAPASLVGEFPSHAVSGPGSSAAQAVAVRRLRRSLFAFLGLLFSALSLGPFLSHHPFGVPVALTVVPFLGALIGGLAVGMAWTAVTVVALCLMAIGVSDDPTRSLVAWNAVIVAGVVGIGGCLSEAARDRARREADASSREASGLARSREETEAELEESRELLALAFRRTPAMLMPMLMLMLMLSELTTGRIIDVNEFFERRSGWTLEEVRGRTLSELNAWVSIEDRQRLIDSILHRGGTQEVELVMRTRTGREIWLLGAADILESNGRTHVLSQAIDITDRKRAEQALALSRQMLEDRVVERSERLRASQIALRRLRQLASIGTLAAGLAHQINNPIAAIMASAEYALLAAQDGDESADAIRDGALRSVISEAARCGQIVKNVLRFARQQPTARWVEDLGPLVRRTATICRSYVVEHGGELRIDALEETLPALISPIEIEQVLVNLIRNAAEALDGRGGVRIGVHRRDRRIEIAIDDEGCGISRERLDHLFEPFYTTRVQPGGTGLGLSFAHGVIVDHGGEIHVESEVGKGTRFRILLPLAPDTAPASASAVAARPLQV